MRDGVQWWGWSGCDGRSGIGAEWLVRERGVVVCIRGSFYGMGEKNRVVLSLIGPEGGV